MGDQTQPLIENRVLTTKVLPLDTAPVCGLGCCQGVEPNFSSLVAELKSNIDDGSGKNANKDIVIITVQSI